MSKDALWRLPHFGALLLTEAEGVTRVASFMQLLPRRLSMLEAEKRRFVPFVNSIGGSRSF